MRENTLLFLIKPDTSEVLLAMKKRGFGEGKLNGVGGKIELGESVAAAAVREAQEEISVDINPSDLTKVGEIFFSFDQKPDWDIHCYVFLTDTWTGEPAESEEMAPSWFKYDQVPYDQMWVDDKFWLPQVLEGKRLKATFHFSSEGDKILLQQVEISV